MMLNCKIHGYSAGIQVSFDVHDALYTQPLPPFRLVEFEYKGDIADEVIISWDYSVKFEVPSMGPIPLPDEYPVWYLKLDIACRTCVESAEQAET